MNEIEKAIEILKRKSTIPNNEESFIDIENAYDVAIHTLEKQIPKKALDKKISFHIHSSLIKSIYGKCPMCGTVQADDKYCQHCGQALDWSIEE